MAVVLCKRIVPPAIGRQAQGEHAQGQVSLGARI
jgi:hypothetical protein